MVWTFRYLSKSKKAGDFELLGLSAIWGLASLLIFEAYIQLICAFGPWSGCPAGDPQKAIQQTLSNPFAFAIVFSFSGVAFGWMGYKIATSNVAKWVVKRARGSERH